ncbi:MAG TPA: polyphenol oxidase family protein, partial [Alphaproteobacteria bacterium]
MTDDIFDGGAVLHGFFGKRGGVSRGIYDSLNCGLGSGDDAEAVAENRVRVEKKIGVKKHTLLTLRQVHSDICIDVTEPWSGQGAEADAMVTDVPGLALGILTADCAPVLFAGKTKAGKSVIGAAHAGWKGALGGVLESTVRAMVKKDVLPESI